MGKEFVRERCAARDLLVVGLPAAVARGVHGGVGAAPLLLTGGTPDLAINKRRCNLLRCFCGARGRRTLEPALRRTRRVKAARVHATRFSNFRRVATLRARRILRLLLRLPRLLRLQIGKTAR